MATIIDFTAKLNERRALTEQSRRDQAKEAQISEHIESARAAVNNGQVEEAAAHVVAVVEMEERSNRYMPAYCDPSNDRRGSKYEATKNLSVCDLPALMRADIKNAFTRGLLPKGLKVSVRRVSCTWSWSIEIRITGLPQSVELYNPEYLRWTGNLQHEVRWPDDQKCDWRNATLRDVPGGMYSSAVQKSLQVLEEIHGAYQRDNSDSMSDYFDVRYYGSVGIDWKLER